MNHGHFVWMPRCDRPTRSGRLKWKFRSELAAQMVAYGFAHEGKRFRKNRVLHTYDCPYCDGWHTTRQEQYERATD